MSRYDHYLHTSKRKENDNGHRATNIHRKIKMCKDEVEVEVHGSCLLEVLREGELRLFIQEEKIDSHLVTML